MSDKSVSDRIDLGHTIARSMTKYPDPELDLGELWGELLKPYPFNLWFARLTFRQYPEKGKGRLAPFNPDTVRGAFYDLTAWIRRYQGCWPEGVFVVDYGARRGRLHLHALLGNCAGLRRLSVMDFWHNRYGDARVYDYEPGKGARYYLSRKYISRKAELEFTPGFGRLSGLLPTATAVPSGIPCDLRDNPGLAGATAGTSMLDSNGGATYPGELTTAGQVKVLASGRAATQSSR